MLIFTSKLESKSIKIMKVLDNPFTILKCYPESPKSYILQQAEKRSFDIDEHICIEAKNILLNPNKRLEAEISWFPGLDYKKISEKFDYIFNNMEEYVSNFIFEKTEHNLAEANFLTFGLENEKHPEKWSTDNIRLAINSLCYVSEKINIKQIKELIEKSRQVSNFPSNISDEELEYYINEQKKLYRNTLYDFLKKLDSAFLANILVLMLEEATNFNKNLCKWSLLEGIIYDYEFDIKPVLEKQDLIIQNNINSIKNEILPLKNSKLLDESIEILEKKLSTWNNAVKPFKLLKMNRGIDDEYCESVFFFIRDLSITSANEYDNYEFSMKLIKLCKQHFSELRKVSELLDKDQQVVAAALNK